MQGYAIECAGISMRTMLNGSLVDGLTSEDVAAIEWLMMQEVVMRHCEHGCQCSC